MTKGLRRIEYRFKSGTVSTKFRYRPTGNSMNNMGVVDYDSSFFRSYDNAKIEMMLTDEAIIDGRNINLKTLN